MLQEIRLKRGLSQSQLAKKCGIPKQTLQRYEGGFANINGARLETLLKLCNALDCDLLEILTDSNVRKLYFKYQQLQGATR